MFSYLLGIMAITIYNQSYGRESCKTVNQAMPERLAVCFTGIYLQRFACYSEARVLFKCLLAGAGIPRL